MSDNTILAQFGATGEEALLQALKNIAAEMRAADNMAVRVAEAMKKLDSAEGGVTLANKNMSAVLKSVTKELNAMQAAANIQGLERVAANIMGAGSSIKSLEANAYAASRGFSLLSQTIIRDPVAAFRQLASGAALAESGLTRLGVASQALNELLSFASVSRFGAIALLYGTLSKAKQGFDLGIAGAKEFDQALVENARFLVAGGQAAAEAEAQIKSLVAEQRKFAMSWAVTVEEQSKASQMLISSGIAIDAAKKAYQDFAKVKLAFPEVELNSFTNAMVGLMNVSKNMTGYKQLGDDAARLKKLLDEVTATAAVAVMEPKDLPTLVGHMSAVASAAGLLPEEMLAVAGTLTNLGIKAQTASRLFRGLIVSLSTKEKLAALEDMGILIEKTKPLGPQLMGILAQLLKVMNVDSAGSTTIAGLEELNKILPAERATIAAALMKDLNNAGVIYNTNLQAIVNSAGAVDKAAEQMNKGLLQQEKILQNIKKEAASTIADIVGLGDVYSGLAYITLAAAAPASVFALGLKEIGLAAASAVFGLKAFEDMVAAAMNFEGKKSKEEWENFKLSFQVFSEESIKSYQQMETHITNIFEGAEKLRAINTKMHSQERVDVTKREVAEIKDAIAGLTPGGGLIPPAAKFQDLKFMQEMFDKLQNIKGIKLADEIDLENKALFSSINLLKAAGTDTEKLKKAFALVVDETIKLEGNHKKIEAAIWKVINATDRLISSSSGAAKSLAAEGMTRQADELLRRDLDIAEASQRAAITEEQKVKAIESQLKVLESMRDLKVGPYDGRVGDLILSKTQELQKMHEQALRNFTEEASAGVSKFNETSGITDKIMSAIATWPDLINSATQSTNKLGGGFNEAGKAIDGISKQLATLAQQIVNMPQLKIGGAGNSDALMKDFEDKMKRGTQ